MPKKTIRKYRALLVDAHVAAARYLVANVENNIGFQPHEVQERLREELDLMDELIQFMLSRRNDAQ